MLHSKLNGHVFTIRIGGDAAASALKGELHKDAERLRESIQGQHRQNTLARLRVGIDAAPEYKLAAQEAVAACVDMTCDEKDRLVAECQYVSASLVSSARQQEQRLVGSIREALLMLDMIAAALDSSDATCVHELYAQWMMAMGNTIEILDCTYNCKFVQTHAGWQPFATCTLVVKYIFLVSANAVFTAGIASPRHVMSE